jgi:hypothetical protein
VPCTTLDHRYVYRRTEPLSATGAIYHYQIRDLRDVFIFQQIAPDPVMYLVDDTGRIVARNDDYDGAKSELIYRPEKSGNYTLIIRSFSFFSPGYCDLWRGMWVSGLEFYGGPKIVESDILFWGTTRLVTWSPGQVFETTNSTGDPYLICLFADQVGGNAYFGPGIDDAGAGLNSRFVAPPFVEGGTGPAVGRVVLGSYSRSTQGECELCQDDPSALVSPREDSSSRQMQQFAAQLRVGKDALEELEPGERDRQVAELLQKIHSKDEGSLQVMAPAEPTPELISSHEEYLRQSKELEQEPEGVSHNERFRRLEELEARMLGL